MQMIKNNHGHPLFCRLVEGQLISAFCPTDLGSCQPGTSIDFASVGDAVAFGICHAPRTVLTDIWMLRPGEKLEINVSSPQSWKHTPYIPAYLTKLDGSQLGNPTELGNRLTTSVQKVTEKRSSIVLLLTAGKDSTGIATAMAKGGITPEIAVTFAFNENDDEGIWAGKVAKKFGFRHRVFVAPQKTEPIRAALEGAWVKMGLPCLDPSFVPFAWILREIQPSGSLIIEGTGNDGPFAFLVRSQDKPKFLSNFMPHGLKKLLRRVTPFSNPLSYYLKTPVHTMLPGYHLWPHLTDQLIAGQKVDELSWKRETPPEALGFGQELKNYALSYHFDFQYPLSRTILAAEANEAEAAFPWLDQSLCEWIGNLKWEQKVENGVRNKGLLRKWLRETIDYDDAAIGKRMFGFESTKFVEEQFGAISAEILSCKLYEKKAAYDFLKQTKPSDRRCCFSILDLYLLAGWANRSSYSPVR